MAILKTLLSVLFLFLLIACGDNNECGESVVISESRYRQRTVQDSLLAIRSIDLDGDCLTLTIGYSGCSQGHDIDLLTAGDVAESLPVQVTFRLNDKNGREACQAYFEESYEFDLHPFTEMLTSEKEARLLFPDQGKEVLWKK